MKEEQMQPKSQNEKKHEMISAWSMYLWEDLDRRLEEATS